MTKGLLRKDGLSRRQALSSDQTDEKNRLIAEKVIQLLNDIAFETIHIFLPQRNKREVDTWQILAKLRLQFPEKTLALPYIIPGSRQMKHHALTSETVLIDNRWGIPEADPFRTPEVSPDKIDVVLLPLIVFDKNGYRVGYGGGYYDRFLAQCRPDTLKIGLSFFDPVERIEDIDQFDVGMNCCVTPEKVWWW